MCICYVLKTEVLTDEHITIMSIQKSRGLRCVLLNPPDQYLEYGEVLKMIHKRCVMVQVC